MTPTRVHQSEWVWDSPTVLSRTPGMWAACGLQLLLISVARFPPGMFTQVALQCAVFLEACDSTCLHLISVFLIHHQLQKGVDPLHLVLLAH